MEQGSVPPGADAGARARRSRRLNVVTAIVLALIAIGVYASSVHRAFVYDDDRQIVQNIFLQDYSHFWRAMTSDVWAFRPRPDGGATSNYWRPTFVLWLMLNERVLGLENAVGWHASSVLLHAAAVVMIFSLLRMLRMSLPVAASIALLFAVHPAHVESVSWISGSPDPLVAILLLGAWMLVISAHRRPSKLKWIGALVVYAFALMSKEIAVAFPIVLFVALLVTDERPVTTSARLRTAFDDVSPFLGLVVLFFLARLGVFGWRSHNPLGTSKNLESILTIPATTMFYLRQSVWPVVIGPAYPNRPVTPETIGLWNVVIPLAATAAFLVFAIWRGRRDPIAWIGLAIAAAFIAPTMNVDTFSTDQIVHDRYLYLPLLGGLMILAPAAAALFTKLLRRGPGAGDWALLCVAAALSVPLAAKCTTASAQYTSNLALWETGVRTDPTSEFTWRQYATYLQQAGRLKDAARAYDASIDIKPTSPALLGRSEIAMLEHRLDDAQRDLLAAIKEDGRNWSAYERIAVCLDLMGKPEASVSALRAIRRELPANRCAITERMSIYLERAGQPEEAVKELESVRPFVLKEVDARARLVLFRLGLLYPGANQPEQAKRAFQDFLAATGPMTGPEFLQARATATAALRELGG